MEFLVTGDLHYENERSRPSARALAEELVREKADALILAGDSFAFDLSLLEESLHLFDAFPGKKLFVMGNHCLWVREGGDSFRRYTQELPEAVERLGWHCLDRAPLILGRVGVAGTVGWYDYSFRDSEVEVPERFYEAKIGPGAALADPRYRRLLREKDDLRPGHFRIRSRWMDGEYVRWRFSDREFTGLTAARLAEHLAFLRDRVNTIVAVLHHVPFREMVRRKPGDPSWNFANAFQGSAALGRVLLSEPKVKHLVCAHVHLPQATVVGEIACYNVGSGIRKKRAVRITVPE